MHEDIESVLKFLDHVIKNEQYYCENMLSGLEIKLEKQKEIKKLIEFRRTLLKLMFEYEDYLKERDTNGNTKNKIRGYVA